MKTKTPLLSLLAILVAGHFLHAQSIVTSVGNTTVHIDTILEASSINAPWDIEMQGTNLWFTDATRIKRYNTNTQELTTLFVQANKYALGIVLHPDFDNNPLVFVVFSHSKYYSSSSGASIYRYDYSSVLDSLINETEIFQYPHSGEHAGGRLAITSDDKLLLTTADYWIGQDCDTCTSEVAKKGKILRMNFDGSVPSDNPFPNTYTYSRGHRNPQGLTITYLGEIYSNEHSQQTTKNELNHIIPTENYGWPVYDGSQCFNFIDSCSSPTYNPKFPEIDSLFPPSGLDYYASNAIPEFEGSLLGGVLGFGNGLPVDFDVVKLNSTHEGVLTHTQYGVMDFGVDFGRIRDISISDDGKVYFICNDRKNLNYWSPGDVTSQAQIMCLYKPIATNTHSVNQSFVKVYPNPANHTLHLKASASTSIEGIYSLMGSLIYSAKSSTQHVDIKNLTSGMYFLKTSTGEFISFIKD